MNFDAGFQNNNLPQQPPQPPPPITFCGVVLPGLVFEYSFLILIRTGRPVVTSLQSLSLDKYLLPIENISDSSHVCVFLTGNPPISNSMVCFIFFFFCLFCDFKQGCAIYLSIYPFTNWQYIGSIHNTKPSTILRFRWPQDAIDKNITAQLGINIISLDDIAKLETQKEETRRNILSNEGDAIVNKIGLLITSYFKEKKKRRKNNKQFLQFYTKCSVYCE
jgi:hypothetical protein